MVFADDIRYSIGSPIARAHRPDILIIHLVTQAPEIAHNLAMTLVGLENASLPS